MFNKEGKANGNGQQIDGEAAFDATTVNPQDNPLKSRDIEINGARAS